MLYFIKWGIPFEKREEIIRSMKGVSNILKMSEWERPPGIGYGTLGGYLEPIKSGLSYNIDWRLFPHSTVTYNNSFSNYNLFYFHLKLLGYILSETSF